MVEKNTIMKDEGRYFDVNGKMTMKEKKESDFVIYFILSATKTAMVQEREETIETVEKLGG